MGAEARQKTQSPKGRRDAARLTTGPPETRRTRRRSTAPTRRIPTIPPLQAADAGRRSGILQPDAGRRRKSRPARLKLQKKPTKKARINRMREFQTEIRTVDSLRQCHWRASWLRPPVKSFAVAAAAISLQAVSGVSRAYAGYSLPRPARQASSQPDSVAPPRAESRVCKFKRGRRDRLPADHRRRQTVLTAGQCPA